MKRFLRMVYVDVFDQGGVSAILGVMLWAVSIVILFIFMGFLLLFIDSVGTEIKQKEGVITEHYYIPAHTERRYVHAGKSGYIVNNHVKASYCIEIEIDGLHDKMCLRQSVWKKIEVGDKFCFNYSRGRITKDMNVRSFCDK